MDERNEERNELNDFAANYIVQSEKEAFSQEPIANEPIASESITVEPAAFEPFARGSIKVESVISDETGSDSTGSDPIISDPIISEESIISSSLPADTVLISNDSEPVTESPIMKKKPRYHNMGKKLAAACLVAVLGGGSIGVGLGVGQRLSKKFIPEPQATEAASFAFSSYTLPVSQTNANSTLSAANNNVAQVVQQVADSVVSINITGQAQKTFFNQIYEPKGAGSGIIFSEDADSVYIVTNYHVIEDATKVSISIDDEAQAPARYVGGDSQADVAVIGVNKSDLKEAGITEYKVAEFADSDSLMIGETVLAIGNALGEGKTVTLGIVSAIKKQTALQNKTMDLIQTDAAINQGNSGGPLVNAQGKVVGINTAKLAGNGIEGMGYSIPSNTAKTAAMELLENGTVDRPYLGVEVFSVTEDMQRMYDLPSLGVYVKGVVPGGSAEAAGLQVSDIIVGYGDVKVTKTEDLTEAIAASKSGDVVKIYIYRSGKTPMVLEATLKNMNEKF